MDDCIEFQKKARHKQGYGVATFRGKRLLAHRVAFFAAYGWWPKVVRHRCDNPPCVNIEHLLPGTQLDNVRDREERGRGNHARGSRIAQAKLTDELASEIRALAAEGWYSQQKIADAYGVNQTVVSSIVRGATWGGGTHDSRPGSQD